MAHVHARSFIYIYTCFYYAFFDRPAIRHIKVEWQIIAIANAVLEFWSVAIVGPVRSMHHLAYLSSMNVGQHRCVSVWKHNCFHAFYANKVRLKAVQQLSKRSMLSAQFCHGSAVSSVFFFGLDLRALGMIIAISKDAFGVVFCVFKSEVCRSLELIVL